MTDQTVQQRSRLAELRSRVEPTALARENAPGSDTRILIAAEALSRDLRGIWGLLREQQWEHASPAGMILVAPQCYSRGVAL